MPMRVRDNAYYFEATVMRKNGPMPRHGSVHAANEANALKLIDRITAGWDVPIIKLKVYEIGDEGEIKDMVATTTYGTPTLPKPEEDNPKQEVIPYEGKVVSLKDVGTPLKYDAPPTFKRKSA